VRRLLVFLGVMWVAANLFGAWVSVDHDRPYDLSFLDAPGKVGRIGDDWLYGWGTGLAMPLWFLAVVAILTVVVSFGGNPTKLGSVLLLLAGAASLAFTLSNQLTHDRLDATSADRVETAIIGATLLLAGLMVLVALLTVITTPKQHRH
jgi:hypothetical protein